MKLHLEIAPKQFSQDVLFIHGNLASTRWWDPLRQEWPKMTSGGSGDLLFADWRGCGQNPEWPGDKNFSIEDLAADFLELLEEQKRAPVALVGHSLGGLIALQMMSMAPKMFSKAVLLDPVGAEGIVFDESMYEAFRQMAERPDLTRVVILGTLAMSDHLPEEFKDRISEDAQKAVRGIGSSVLEILKTVDLREKARWIPTSTLILHGQLDHVIPLSDSEKLAGLMPNARLEVVPDAGHCLNVEKPELFTKYVINHLNA